MAFEVALWVATQRVRRFIPVLCAGRNRKQCSVLLVGKRDCDDHIRGAASDWGFSVVTRQAYRVKGPGAK